MEDLAFKVAPLSDLLDSLRGLIQQGRQQALPPVSGLLR